MPGHHLHARYHFRNVGQGLFASGTVRLHRDAARTARWVYDCGTLSADKLLTDGIVALEEFFGGKERIDLVALSHFDKDHISGICRVIADYPVDVLLLPYVPRWKRLLIALAEGVMPGDAVFGFFVDPVAYLTGVNGADVRRIVFVLPGGETPPPPPSNPPAVSPQRPSDHEHNRPDEKLTVPVSTDPPPETFAIGADGSRVIFVDNGTPLTFDALWEFVPYNDDLPVPLPPGFADRAGELGDTLCGPATRNEKEKTLKELKAFYAEELGRSAVRKNQISLHLYGGPVSDDGSTRGNWTFVYSAQVWNHFKGRIHVPIGPLGPGAVLYSGDGYLKTPAQLKRLIDYLTDDRIARVGVFQVMHHGAEGNWHAGVAERISPLFSVFSADPGHTHHHPHAPVVHDFAWHRPTRVDLHDRATFHFDVDC